MKTSCLNEHKPVVRNLIILSKEIQGSFADFAETNFPKELSQAESRVVGYICRHQGCFSVEISEDFHLVKSTVSTMVNSLEDKGYIRTVASTSDKRKNHLYPTEKALQVHSEIERCLDMFDLRLEGGLTEEEKTILFRAFQKIENNVEEVRK